ncbi:hypothetical protein AN478_12950 [Thiohalorhabdus denitrificans]|uniref:Uncharacterized protein n=1 Tax=Thiohalorhabdus denitrificans TaxID=381306 RepID=A0A0P9CR76_9GAMM|nr:hypothetical protein [Thiohalorhabdus denitrificans]KPV39179.1 hypothetical protein AN478_12950 [Thiohalorhabdus denitrificans]SCX75722.1 hypothetical protein SAMN05661077_0262 [Thiohalorhabdus denitrificans]
MASLPERDEQIVHAHAGLIHRVVLASHDRGQVPDLEEVLDQAENNGWVQLVVAVRRILAGARGEDLMHGLDDEDRVVVDAILRGIQDPSTLPDPQAGADPAMAASGLASIIHAAGTGQSEALQWAAQMAEQMYQAGGDMTRLSAIIRPMINGERDRGRLTRGMGEQGRQLVDGILEELAKLEEQ